MHTISMFKQYKYMNDIYVYYIQTYEKQILHDYYCQIHEVCDVALGKPKIKKFYNYLD
jgi:hypothetical protein